MNHAQSDVKVDLKICEGCGALWFRAQSPGKTLFTAYCSRCAGVLAELPAPRPARVPRHTRANHAFTGLQLVGGTR